MNLSFSIEERKPVWMALSEFYLDTELSDNTFIHIAETFKKSPYSFAEIREINKKEVFPLLQVNLLNVAGEWKGFDEEWLVTTILFTLEKQNLKSFFFNKFYYIMFQNRNKSYWKKVQEIYNNL
ncbi:hypothetical protein [Flavobacterium sp.]|uniref:DUF7079 family protein n=1 Tax=Flavobacterium sp. TaxID=239 RepID=UPI00286DA694|nr:hypothetical protein [Flavobacterium sp.]